MGAKSILLLGLIISALFIYLCIDSKKDALYAQLVDKKEAVPLVKPQEVLEPIIIKKAKKDASFAYVAGEKVKIAAIFSKEDNNSQMMTNIEKICKDTNCIKDIEFRKDITPYHFTNETLALIQKAKDTHITDFALYVDKKHVTIEGTVMSNAQSEQFKTDFKPFLDANYTIENKTILKTFTPAVEEKIDIKPTPAKKVPKETIIKEEISSEIPRDIFVTPQHLSPQEASEEINNLLNAHTITFDYRSSEISKASKKTLDDIADILLGLDDIMIEVAGYTDSKGDAIYNKVLSQKRADSVRHYLITAGVRAALIRSKGYGEKDPIAAPEDIINRRVEIHIMEGK